MNILKVLTSRNAFSREYGTWLIVLFSLIYVPLIYNVFNQRILFYCFSVFTFLMFRFELLDYYTIQIQYKKRRKLFLAIMYLFLSGVLFSQTKLDLLITIVFGITGIALTVFNIHTRRRKGRRQSLLSQTILVLFIAFIGAFNYYLLFDEVNGIMLNLLIINALYYINTLIYVRSKTEGAPYHLLAVLSLIASMGLILLLGQVISLKPILILLFIPSFIKVLDNVILENNKVHLRRIGMNEIFHAVLFLLLMNYLSSSI